jgi:hypothetical protein
MMIWIPGLSPARHKRAESSIIEERVRKREASRFRK